MRESRGVCRTAGREIEFGEEKLELQPLKGAIDCEHLRHRSSDALYETYVFRDSESLANPEGNYYHCFERHRFARSFRREELPARQSAGGIGIQTLVRTVEDANVTDSPVGMNHRIQSDHAMYVGSHQFQRIAWVGFLSWHRREQGALLRVRLHLGQADHPASRRRIQVRHIRLYGRKASVPKNLIVDIGNFVVGHG